jgi:two-component system alkaline phosphatase synthesis response regulator PhoP
MATIRPFRVMVIDDDKDILDLLDYNLRKEGFRVKIIDDGRDAVEEANVFNPDLIILDIMMPHASGFDICRRLRTSTGFTEIYIFFLTALSDHHYQREAYTTGADDYIEKIVGLRSLTYKINTVLKNQYIIRKRQLSLQAGELLIDRETSSATQRGKTISLSPAEFELLSFWPRTPARSPVKKRSLITFGDLKRTCSIQALRTIL